MEVLINVKPCQLPKVFLKLKALTILEPFPLSQNESHPLSCMGIFMTWNNLSGTFKIIPFDTLRNISMALSSPLGLGMLKWIDFF